MSEIASIFQSLPGRYVPGNMKQKTVYYFSLDEDEKWTITFTPEACTVEAGNTRDADCFVKGSKALFMEIWNGRYVPSLTDFLTGKIRSNNPLMLKEFYAAFQKKQSGA